MASANEFDLIVPPELARWPKQVAQHDPTEAFRQLSHSQAAIRLEGAKWVARQAHGAANLFTEYWLRDGRTLDRLLPLLHDPEPQVVEEIVGAVGMIVSERYRPDPRPISRAIELTASERPSTRIRAILLLANFDDTDGRLTDAILQRFADPDKAVRAIAVGEIAAVGRGWTPEVQAKVRLAALERLGDRTMEVRVAAAKLLHCVGVANDAKTLKQGLKTIKGVNFRQDYREAIGMLETRLKTEK